MSSFQEDFYLETSNPLRRLWRNVRLAGYVLELVWFWLVRGGPIRRAVKRARRTGEPFFVDALSDGNHEADAPEQADA